MSTSLMTPLTAPPVATASGWLALLQESDVALKTHALNKLLACVDILWHEVAEALPDLEAISEDDAVPLSMRQTAAAVASRVFFHLQEPSQALRLALVAGETHFDVTTKTPYVERLTRAALDTYCAKSSAALVEEQVTVDATAISMDSLRGLVYRMMELACRAGNYQHALGIALEARETDKVKDIVLASNHSVELLEYALRAAVSVISNKLFRNEILAVVAASLEQRFLSSTKSAAYDLVLVHQLLKQTEPVSVVLTALLEGSEDDVLLAYQLCFDLVDSGDQAYANGVASGLEINFKGTDPTRLNQALRVLTGGFSSELALSFLHKNSNADRFIIESLKKTMEERGSGGRNSILHNAAVMTHAYLYAGTTNDSFLRDHLDWMKKASNWCVPGPASLVCGLILIFLPTVPLTLACSPTQQQGQILRHSIVGCCPCWTHYRSHEPARTLFTRTSIGRRGKCCCLIHRWLRRRWVSLCVGNYPRIACWILGSEATGDGSVVAISSSGIACQ